MEILLTNNGSYPRIGDTPELQRHRRAYAQWERGEITENEFRRVEDEVTAEAIREQVEAGLDVVTDGQIRWYDPFSHLARALEGVEINGLLRYFDTNTYFRQPVVRGRVARRGPILLREFEFARSVATKPVKPVLTGPYTLARGSVLKGGYKTIRDLTLAYAEVLALEVGDLAGAGARWIQVDEPALLSHPDDLELVREAVGRLVQAKGTTQLIFATSFGDVTPIYGDLQTFAVDMLGLDLTYSPKLPRLIQDRGTARGLSLGLVDARNTKLETADQLFPVLDRILPGIRGPVHLGPSCGLEFLPRGRARAKLQNLKTLRDAFLARA